MFVYIDDERDLLETFSMIMELEGYNVETFNEHDPAREFIMENQDNIECIFCDNRMPSGSGEEFLASLELDIPMFIVTGDFGKSEPLFPIIEKPFKIDSIIRAVKKGKEFAG